MALLDELPDSQQHRCGFSPGWSIRAYADSLGIRPVTAGDSA
ncbi:hypothetical protein [Streptomyces sp. NPDC017991]